MPARATGPSGPASRNALRERVGSGKRPRPAAILDVVGPESVPGCTRGSTITFRVNGRPAPDTAVNEPVEKLLPWRAVANRGVAVVLVVLGIAVTFAPDSVPGLTLPDSAQARDSMRMMGPAMDKDHGSGDEMHPSP